MKPVVSSLVALAIAIAPLSVMAKPAPHEKASHAKVVKHKVEKTGKTVKTAKADKVEKSDKTPMVRVKAGKKDGVAIKNVVHHAHNVDLGGAGHREPKVENGVLVAASMKSPAAPVKTQGKSGGLVGVKASSRASVSASKAEDMPRLPNPNAVKPNKGGAEKGARKSVEKKAESSDDGERARDEEIAELVARIRGRQPASSENEQGTSGGARDAKAAKNVPQSAPKGACTKDPVEIVRGPEIERFELTKCDGTVAPLAAERLSISDQARRRCPSDRADRRAREEAGRRARSRYPSRRPASRRAHPGGRRPLQQGGRACQAVRDLRLPPRVRGEHALERARDRLPCRGRAQRGRGRVLQDAPRHRLRLLPEQLVRAHRRPRLGRRPRELDRRERTWRDAAVRPGVAASRGADDCGAPPSSREDATQRSFEELAEEGASLLRARRPYDGAGRWAERDGMPDSSDDHPAEEEK